MIFQSCRPVGWNEAASAPAFRPANGTGSVELRSLTLTLELVPEGGVAVEGDPAFCRRKSSAARLRYTVGRAGERRHQRQQD